MLWESWIYLEIPRFLCDQTPFSWYVVPSILILTSMPTHTIHSSFTVIFTADSTHPSAPWNFPGWQQISRFTHSLFSEDDSLLPAGWTCEMATAIQSYFKQCAEKKTEDAKIKFTTATKANSAIPGCKYYMKWFNAMWLKCGISSQILKIICKSQLNPMTIWGIYKRIEHHHMPQFADQPSRQVPLWLSSNESTCWSSQ